jgi:UDP-N-acetyl-D-glucosamine/UDP-N-acetyl-D-galactosamine dehydrogenase
VPERIAVIGLGYVGLPLALALARKFPGTLGFDVNAEKLKALKAGVDGTGECEAAEIAASGLTFTGEPADLKTVRFFVVAVPTPVDAQKRPDLTPVTRASETVGKALTPGAVVVYESTVYPGVTEEICGPILERVSGLKRGVDFTLGYSPERINPGDKLHTLDKIVKVVSAENAPTLERVAAVYGAVVSAGVYRAASIRVAEAAKVIENTQRDVNIALMNELALIFDRMGIRTKDVLDAAGTKWNFLKFFPGLVGGHCIGVDPYYLTAKAEEYGYTPEVILSGRRINDSMGAFVAQKTLKLIAGRGRGTSGARIGILGLTFKENVPDLRNSRVPDIVRELSEFGAEVLIHDPHASPEEAHEEYGLTTHPLSALTDLDAIVLAVSHARFAGIDPAKFLRADGGVVVDVKAQFDPASFAKNIVYWSL